MGANGFEHGQRLGVAVDIVLQLGALVANVFGIDENGRDTGIDHGRFQSADTRHFQFIHQITRGEHGPFAIGRVHKLDLHFRRREGYAIQFKITGLLHFTVGDGHVGHDGFADVGLPYTNGTDAVFGNTLFGDKAAVNGECAYGGGEIAAVTTPVDKGFIDGHLAKQIIDVVVRLRGRCQDYRFTGAGGGITQAVDLLFVGIGATNYTQQKLVSRFTGYLAGFGQILQAEEDAFTGTATHVGGRNTNLGSKTH